VTREYTRRAFASLLGGLGAAGATSGLAQPADDGEVGLDTYTTVISPGASELEFNPYGAGLTAETVVDAVFERFARHDLTDGGFVLVGLEDWSVDGDAVTLTVREGLTWHDGEPVTAADLETKLLLDEMPASASVCTSKTSRPSATGRSR